MSDRKRRWICRLVFMVACILPTIWAVGRVRYQPTPQQWSTELLVNLGLPILVGRVNTPDPSTILLKNLIWDHPELGRVAEIRQLMIMQTAVSDLESRKWQQNRVLQNQTWHIDELKVRESALEEVLATLNQQWLRQQRSGIVPEIKIDRMEVVRTDDSDPLTVLMLTDVTIRTQEIVGGEPDRNGKVHPRAILVIGTVRSLSPPTIVGGKEWIGEGVPFAFRSQRAMGDDFYTDWFLSLDRPLPALYVGLSQLPKVLRVGNFSVEGSFSGRAYEDQWVCSLHDIKLTGPANLNRKFRLENLAEWFGVPEARGQIHGMANLHVRAGTLRSLPNATPELVELDAHLEASEGGISKKFLSLLRSEFQSPNQLSRPQELQFFPSFDRLDVRLFVRDGRLKLRPSGPTQQSLALMTHEDQVLLSATDVPYILANLNDLIANAGKSDPWNCLGQLLPKAPLPQPGIVQRAAYQE